MTGLAVRGPGPSWFRAIAAAKPRLSFCLLVFALTLCLVSLAPATPVVDLGSARGYAVVGQTVTLGSSNTYVLGDVGVASGGSFRVTGAGQVVGIVYHHPGTSVTVSAGSSIGGQVVQDMTPVTSAIVTAASTASSLSPDRDLGWINNETGTINRTGAVSVFQAGDLRLTSGARLTLNGLADDLFIFNLLPGGDITMLSGAYIELTGGLMTSNVLFNVMDPNGSVSIMDGSVFRGTILAPHSDIEIGGGVVRGAVYSVDKSIILNSGGQIFHEIFAPEPATLALLALGGLTILKRRKN